MNGVALLPTTHLVDYPFKILIVQVGGNSV